MVYAIVQTGGKQYRVQAGDVLDVEQLEAEPGSEVSLEQVLLVGGEGGVQIGRPFVSGARVVAEVLDQIKGPKLIVFKMKPKTRYRRKNGHRQRLTRIKVKEILV